MEQSKQQRIRELTDRLNRCRYEYYNLNAPSLTDAEYDCGETGYLRNAG